MFNNVKMKNEKKILVLDLLEKEFFTVNNSDGIIGLFTYAVKHSLRELKGLIRRR